MNTTRKEGEAVRNSPEEPEEGENSPYGASNDETSLHTTFKN
jgi:hypothetical protein